MAPPMGLLALSSRSLHPQRQALPLPSPLFLAFRAPTTAFSDPFYLLIYVLIICPPPWTVSSWELQLCHAHFDTPAHCHTAGQTVGAP